jgi:acetolactate synthase-1/2/3 large subunit
MDTRILDDLFSMIVNETKVVDVAYHEIANGKLNPIHKTDTSLLGIDTWKKEHYKNPVYIEHTPILQEIVSQKKTVTIMDTHSDSRSANEFFFFGIQSIMIIPVIKNNSVVGIVVVPSIKSPHLFTPEEVEACNELVNNYMPKFLESLNCVDEGKKKRIANGILSVLKENGVDFIFGIPAGTVSPIFDAMNDVDIKPIIAKNEGGAAYMAARYASVTKKLGVCIGAGGVGVNNMINGIADAMRAKSPVLLLSGYVNRKYIGKGALQELDTEHILKPITKYSKTVMDDSCVLSELEKAIRLALTPPCGPVHLSIPLDIQLSVGVESIPDKVTIPTKDYRDSIDDLNKAVSLISGHKHGIIMVGKGCRGLSKQVMELSEHLQWPIIVTPEGKGVVPASFPLNLGTYGYCGSDAASQYVENDLATCILILGSSLGECSTCNFNDSLIKGRKSIHVDLDVRELSKVFETDVNINCDIEDTISFILNNTPKSTAYFERPPLNPPYIKNHEGLSIRLFIEEITKILPSNTFYLSDLGEYMNFVFKYLEIPEGGDFEINLNYAAMGSSLAGAIGVHYAFNNRPVAVFAGDGSFYMNGSEIITAKEYNLPIIYIIVNNAMLAYVEHGHQFLYGRVLDGFKNRRISISDMMNSIGIESIAIDKNEDICKVKDFITNMDGPRVIELITDGSEKAPIMDRLKALK